MENFQDVTHMLVFQLPKDLLFNHIFLPEVIMGINKEVFHKKLIEVILFY